MFNHLTLERPFDIFEVLLQNVGMFSVAVCLLILLYRNGCVFPLLIAEGPLSQLFLHIVHPIFHLYILLFFQKKICFKTQMPNVKSVFCGATY